MRNIRVKSAKTSIVIFSLSIVASMVLAGCIGQEEGPDTDVTTFVFGFSSDPSSLDPSIVFDDSSIQMGRVYETLVQVAPDMSIKPVLATSWDTSADGLTWTFNLREGVKFHDGSSFDAEAVKFSFERTLEINEGGAYALYIIDSMEILDQYTIKFTLTAPAPFDYILGSQYATYIMSPSFIQENEVDGDLGQAWLAEHTSGTGPYELTEWIHGQQCTLKKFDDYWGGWEGKHVDTVIIKIVREVSTAEIELKEGKLDSTWALSYETIESFRDDPDFVVEDHNTLHTLYWRINTQKPPTDDILVRKALNYAFPYEEALEAGFLGGKYGERLYGPLPRGIWGYDDDPPLKYEFDLAKAADLLEQAGHPGGGFELDLIYYTPTEYQRVMAELFTSKLAEIGVTLNARGLPFDELLAASCCDPETGPHISAHDWWPTWTDPFDFLYGCWGSDQFFNWIFWNSTEFDELVLEANTYSVTNRAKAIELYKEAQRLVVEDANTIYLAQLKGANVVRSWVHGWEVNINYFAIIDFYAIYKE